MVSAFLVSLVFLCKISGPTPFPPLLPSISDPLQANKRDILTFKTISKLKPESLYQVMQTGYLPFSNFFYSITRIVLFSGTSNALFLPKEVKAWIQNC